MPTQKGISQESSCGPLGFFLRGSAFFYGNDLKNPHDDMSYGGGICRSGRRKSHRMRGTREEYRPCHNGEDDRKEKQISQDAPSSSPSPCPGKIKHLRFTPFAVRTRNRTIAVTCASVSVRLGLALCHNGLPSYRKICRCAFVTDVTCGPIICISPHRTSNSGSFCLRHIPCRKTARQKKRSCQISFGNNPYAGTASIAIAWVVIAAGWTPNFST